MAIIGTHALVYTSEPEAVRRIFRDVLGLDHVTAGEGWLIFALPPAEVGVHPGEAHHELSLLCDNIDVTVSELRSKGVEFRGDPVDRGWGVVATMALPGGLDVLLYEPRHPTAIVG